MKIKSFHLAPCVMGNAGAEWKTAIGTRVGREAWLISFEADNCAVGHGYAPATTHLGSTWKGVEADLNLLAPLVVGKDPFDIEPILTALDHRLTGAPAAKAGIDCALHELLARHLQLPLYKLLGGKFRDSVPVMRILSTKAPDKMAEDAAGLVAEGYRYLKVKVDGDVDADVARVKAVRERVGVEIALTIDANESYTTKNAILAINRMVEHGIALVEQPVKAQDLKGLKLVTDSVPVNVEADESAMSVEDVNRLIGDRIVDAVSLRLPNLGGLRRTLAVARMCEAAAIDYRLGAAVGSRLLAAQSLHLAVGLPNLTFACELGEFDRLTNDPFSGIEIVNGTLTLPGGIGSGLTYTDLK